jgi:hypothetical protein
MRHRVRIRSGLKTLKMVAGQVNKQTDASDPVYNASTFITGCTKSPVQNLRKIPALRNQLVDELPDEFYEFTTADYARLKANKCGKTSAWFEHDSRLGR